MDATQIPILQHLHAQVESAITSPDQEQLMMDALGEDGWEAWQKLSDLIRPLGGPGDVSGDFWNNN